MRPVFLTPLIIACALFMENLDSTILATSLPAIALDLNEDPISLKLALTSYLLALAVFIPASGWVADRYGARTVFRAAIITFTAGSILCGFASSLLEFVGARVIQGIGGAMMVPVGRLVVLRSVPRHDLVPAMAYLTIPALIGPVLGPPVGGFITTYFHWRWIFWINVPIGILGFVLAGIYIKNVREQHPGAFDTVGFILSGLGLSLLIFGMTVAGRGFVSNVVSAELIGGGVLLLALYVRHALRAPNPIIDLRLLGHATFRASVLGGFIFRIGVGAIPFLLPLMLQLGFGLSPFQSGLLTFASSAGALLMKFTAQPILNHLGFRRVLIFNTLISSAFLGLIAAFTPATPHILIIGALLMGGFFRSLQFTSINVIAYADVPDDRMSKATSFASAAQQLSLSFGVAAGAAVLEITRLRHGEAAYSAADFAPAMLTVALISAAAVFVFMALPPNAGEVLTRKRGPVGEE